jgi:RNA polymerase sporulation-specific sigma factor
LKLFREGDRLIQQYFAELSKIKLLTAAEERLLWKEFKEGRSREARQRIIESYQPLVYKITSRICGREEVFFDLIQEGTIGLIEAAESFDPRHEVRFSSFAQHRIRGRIIDFLRRHSAYQESLQIAVDEASFEQIFGQIADETANTEDEVSQRGINRQLNIAIERLNPKERQVIRDLYITDKEPVLIAREMQISLSYLYKLQKKGLQRLRGMLSRLRAELKSHD